MKNTGVLICLGIVVSAYLSITSYYGSKSGMASGIQHCYNNVQEESDGDCDRRAAAFFEKYGHTFDQE